MPSASTNLSANEYAYVTNRVAADSGSISGYLRRIIQEDMQRHESEALVALTLHAMTDVQQEHLRQLGECQSLIESGFKALSDQINQLMTEFGGNSECLMHANQRLLDINQSTADLVAAALTDSRDILDATNTVVEGIDRRMRNLGK